MSQSRERETACVCVCALKLSDENDVLRLDVGVTTADAPSFT